MMRPAVPTPQTPTLELVELAREGNAQAFELLVERHRIRAFSVALRQLRSYDEASDVCQEAMSKAWQRLATLQDPARFGSWLEQIVIHLCLDSKRRQARRVPIAGSYDEAVAASSAEDGENSAVMGPAASPGGDARQRLLQQEIASHILRAIQSLPETLREPAYLKFIEGLDGEQVARILGIEYEAARKRIYRATLELRRRLQALYDELLGPGAP